jgi:hypothetical protein
VVKDKALFQDLVTTRHIHTTKEAVDHRDKDLRCNLSGDNKDLLCSHHSNKVADLPCSSSNNSRPMVNILRTTNSSNILLDQVSLNNSSNNKDPTQRIIPLGTSNFNLGLGCEDGSSVAEDGLEEIEGALEIDSSRLGILVGWRDTEGDELGSDDGSAYIDGVVLGEEDG